MIELAAKWTRVSSGEQDELNQIPRIDSHIERHGYTDSGITYEVHDESAFKGEHVADLEAAINDMAEGKYTVLVARHSDRIDREAKVWQWMAAAHMAGGRIEFVDEPGLVYQPEDDMAETMAFLAGINNRRYSRNISKNVKDAHNTIRANNALIGTPPFGYRIEGVKLHKTLVPIKELIPYIIGMFERYLAGDSLTAICEWLDAEGVKPPRSGIWSQKSISQILRNPIYGTGRRVNASGKTVMKVEPILKDASLARQVIDRLDNAPRKRGAVSSDTAMLTGIIVCAKCFGPMYRKRGRQGLFYRCNGTARNPSQCRNMAALDELEMLVDWHMTEGEEAAKRLKQVFVTPGHGHEDEIADVERDLRELDLDDPEYDAKHSALRAERKRLRELPSEPQRLVERDAGVSVGEHWASLDNHGRREFLLRSKAKVAADKTATLISTDAPWTL